MMLKYTLLILINVVLASSGFAARFCSQVIKSADWSEFPRLQAAVHQHYDRWKGTKTIWGVDLSQAPAEIRTLHGEGPAIDLESFETVTLFRGIGNIKRKDFDPAYGMKQLGADYFSMDLETAKTYAFDGSKSSGIIIKIEIPAFLLANGRVEYSYTPNYSDFSKYDLDSLAPFVKSIGTLDRKSKKIDWVAYAQGR